MTRVALVTDDLDIERRIFQGIGSNRFADSVLTYAELCHGEVEAVAATLAAGSHDVVVLGPRMDPMAALAVAELLDRSVPELVTIVMADPTPELWELAMDAGVRAVLPTDADPARLREAIDRALDAADRRRERMVIDIRDHVAHEAAAASGPHHRLITVIAPKGGSGKTTVSTNLAAGLARVVPGGVALVDLDLQFGDVADALRLDPEHTIGDIRGRASQLDSAELKLLLSQHSSGAFALCAPEDPAVGDEIGSDDIRAALSVLTNDLPYVVVDTAAGIDEAALTAIEMSTDLVLLASNDVPSIRNLRKLITALDRLGIAEPARHLVLNRAGSKVGIEVDDVIETLGLPLTVSIPSSRAIPISVNHGAPIVISDPRSPMARPFFDLVEQFTDVPAAHAGGLSWFRRNGR